MCIYTYICTWGIHLRNSVAKFFVCFVYSMFCSLCDVDVRHLRAILTFRRKFCMARQTIHTPRTLSQQYHALSELEFPSLCDFTRSIIIPKLDKMRIIVSFSCVVCLKNSYDTSKDT